MFMFHMVVKKKDGGFSYPAVVFEKSAVIGVAPCSGSDDNLAGSLLLLANGQKLHIDEGLQHVLEILNVPEIVIRKYMNNDEDKPFFL